MSLVSSPLLHRAHHQYSGASPNTPGVKSSIPTPKPVGFTPSSVEIKTATSTALVEAKDIKLASFEKVGSYIKYINEHSSQDSTVFEEILREEELLKNIANQFDKIHNWPVTKNKRINYICLQILTTARNQLIEKKRIKCRRRYALVLDAVANLINVNRLSLVSIDLHGNPIPLLKRSEWTPTLQRKITYVDISEIQIGNDGHERQESKELKDSKSPAEKEFTGWLEGFESKVTVVCRKQHLELIPVRLRENIRILDASGKKQKKERSNAKNLNKI